MQASDETTKPAKPVSRPPVRPSPGDQGEVAGEQAPARRLQVPGHPSSWYRARGSGAGAHGQVEAPLGEGLPLSARRSAMAGSRVHHRTPGRSPHSNQCHRPWSPCAGRAPRRARGHRCLGASTGSRDRCQHVATADDPHRQLGRPTESKSIISGQKARASAMCRATARSRCARRPRPPPPNT